MPTIDEAFVIPAPPYHEVDTEPVRFHHVHGVDEAFANPTPPFQEVDSF